MTERLFVYGTLAPGRPNAHLLAGVDGTWQPATVRGTLFPEGWGAAAGYPGIVLDEEGDEVRGLVLNSGELAEHWERLDGFEGDGYERVVTSATLEDGRVVEVHVYALRKVANRGSQMERNATMKKDEQAIRQWFEHWMKATKEGELQLARSLIADDAVFLVPGAGEMDKESFAAAATASDPNLDFELDCSIQEIEILGDYAWLRTEIYLAMTDKRSESRSVSAGHSLSILKRHGDHWVVIRDANTMVPVK